MPCAVDGCLMLGEHDIALSRRLSDGTERIEQVRICAEHWQQVRNAVPLSIDGVYLVNDGHGRLEAMPDRTRRG